MTVTQIPVGAVTNQQHGKYYWAAKTGNLYHGANQAVVLTALTAGLPTAYTGGLVLHNPAASTSNLEILEAIFGTILAETNPAVISLAVGVSGTALSGTLTAVPMKNGLTGSTNTPQAKLYSSTSVTLPVAPVLERPLTSIATGAETVDQGPAQTAFDIGGSIILTPGSYCVFVASAATAASSNFFGFTWNEIRI